MKNLVVVLLFVFTSASFVMAQDGCMQFFPAKQGAVLVNKTYDAANNLLSTMTYRVTKAYQYESGTEVEINFTLTDSKGKTVDQGTMKARCDDGTFYLNMANRTLTPDVMKMLGNDTELVGDFLDYPDAFNSDDPYSGNLSMTGGQFTIRNKDNKKEAISVRMFDRKYVTTEPVNTPAGHFYAAKVSFNFETVQNKKSTVHKGMEWYAPNAGIIRSETYDKDGKLKNYTVLASLTGVK